MSERRLRIACVGAGWCTTHRHVPALRAHGGYEIAAIVDRDGNRARDAARDLNIPLAVEASGVEGLHGIDAVTCAVPPDAHHEVARSALEADLPVLLEKPFTIDLADGEELLAQARERRLPLAVMQNFCLAPSTHRVREWVATGRLGTVQAVWAVQMSSPARRLPSWYGELPLGLFYDESPNLIALARLFAREPLEPVSARIRAGTRGDNTPAQVDVALDGESVSATLLMNFESPVSEWHVLVVGDRAAAAVDLFRDIPVFLPGDKRHLAHDVMRTSGAATLSHWAGVARSGLRRVRGRLHYGVDEVMARFHAAVTRGEPLGPIDAADALLTTQVQHWVLEQAGCASSS